jgi:DNA-directed RNA polymerase delta subunit
MFKDNTMTNNRLFSQGQGHIVSDMDGEKVMLSIQNGKYYNLGQLGGEIWELMTHPVSIQEIVTALQSQYDVTQDECEEQVAAFLSQLLEEGLIQTTENEI